MGAEQQLREESRSVARGRREGTPFYMHTAVLLGVGAFATVVIGIVLAIWLLV